MLAGDKHGISVPVWHWMCFLTIRTVYLWPKMKQLVDCCGEITSFGSYSTL